MHRSGVPVGRVAALDLPSEHLVAALVEDPWRVRRGVVEPATATLPPRLEEALQAIRDDLAAHAFSAPDADRLRRLRLTDADLAALANAGQLLRLGEGIVLLPGADEQALQLVRGLTNPSRSVKRARGWPPPDAWCFRCWPISTGPAGRFGSPTTVAGCVTIRDAGLRDRALAFIELEPRPAGTDRVSSTLAASIERAPSADQWRTRVSRLLLVHPRPTGTETIDTLP